MIDETFINEIILKSIREAESKFKMKPDPHFPITHYREQKKCLNKNIMFLKPDEQEIIFQEFEKYWKN